MQARHHDPFSYLGLHRGDETASLRVFAPHSRELCFAQSGELMQRVGDSDFFEWNGANQDIDDHVKLLRTDDNGRQIEYYDTYSFTPQLSDFDLHLFGEGKHWHIYRYLGAHLKTVDGISGVLFQWIDNLLSGRLHCTRVGDVYSSFLPIRSGVVQGSCLGPLLFLI